MVGSPSGWSGMGPSNGQDNVDCVYGVTMNITIGRQPRYVSVPVIEKFIIVVSTNSEC